MLCIGVCNGASAGHPLTFKGTQRVSLPHLNQAFGTSGRAGGVRKTYKTPSKNIYFGSTVT